VRFCWVVAVLSMGSAGLLISFFNTEFLSMFGMSGTAQSDVAAPVIRFVGLFQALTATMMVMKMSMRGAGATRLVTVYSFASMWLIRVGGLWVAMKYFDIGLLGIWKVMMVDVLIQAIIFVWLHLKGDWLNTEV
jgi:MATE family multidrug resistance protein